MTKKRIKAAALAVSAAMAALAVLSPLPQLPTAEVCAVSAGTSISDMPSSYTAGADWIWTNRIMREDSLGINGRRWNSLFDQIIANKGQLNYVVRWQSTQQITYEQRKSFETLVDEGINQWTDWLVGYENWPYQHVKVNIIGWAVLDRSSLLDIHDDEVIWDNIKTHDDLSDSQAGVPADLPCADETLWTFNYFRDRNHVYNGQSFDEYLWCTQNYGDYGGCGGDWGQRLSDNYYLAAASGSGFPHIYWHELGHGFGMTDFYGGEGASDGFPPGGFPGGENSIMMAGSCSYINDFDGWMLRYMWSKINTDTQRFDLANAVDPDVIVTTTTASSPAQTTTTSAATSLSEETSTTPMEAQLWHVNTNGAQNILLFATGTPWAGVEGQYSYWDNTTRRWTSHTFRYENSLGETGTSAIEIDLGAPNVTDTLEIMVWYYAVWDNAANDMVDLDQSELNFIARPIEPPLETTTAPIETTTAPIETTTAPAETTTASQATVQGLRGDANCDDTVDMLDAILIAKAAAGIEGISLTAQGRTNADVDGIDGIGGGDLNRVLRFLASLITEL